MSTLKVCSTCRHWRRYTEELDVKYHGTHTGICGCEKFVYDEQPSEDGMRYWDYEGYAAGFETGEKFGCIHHTPNTND